MKPTRTETSRKTSSPARVELSSAARSVKTLTNPMVEVLKSSLITLYLREIILKGKSMVMEEASHPSVNYTKASLCLTKWTVLGFSSGLMDEFTMAHSKKEKRMVMVVICGQTVSIMKAISTMISAIMLAYFITPMVRSLKVFGKTAKNMVEGVTFGLINPFIQSIIWME
jgi:hypothetical protein